MALPPSYGGSLTPQAAARPRPEPAAYGTDVARGVAALGGSLFDATMRAGEARDHIAENEDRIRLIEDERNVSAAIADRAAGLATSQADLRTQLLHLRENAPEGGAGHEQAANELIDKWTSEFMGTLTDQRVRNALVDNVAAAAGSLRVGEAEFAAGQRAEKLASDFGTLKTTLSNGIYTADPAELGHQIQQNEALWAKAVQAAPLDGNGKAKLLKEGLHDIRFSAAQRVGLENPDALIEMIDKGGLNSAALNDHEIPALRNWAVALKEHREVQARQALNEVRQDARTFLSGLVQRTKEGIPVAPEEFAKARELVSRPDLKLSSEEFDIGKAAVIDGVNRKWDGAPASAIDGRIKQIDAEIARKGDKVDPSLVIERNRLQEILPSRTAEQRNDPLTHYARNGGAVTPLDLTSPASMQNRLNEAKIAQNRLGGRLTVLTDEEAAPLEQRMASGGVAGRIEVMNTIAMGGQEFAIAAARQIAPDNMHFRMATALATLGRDGRAAARDSLMGSEAIAAHKAIVREKEAQAQFGRYAAR
jgi:hypothetical protein